MQDKRKREREKREHSGAKSEGKGRNDGFDDLLMREGKMVARRGKRNASEE